MTTLWPATISDAYHDHDHHVAQHVITVLSFCHEVTRYRVAVHVLSRYGYGIFISICFDRPSYKIATWIYLAYGFPENVKKAYIGAERFGILYEPSCCFSYPQLLQSSPPLQRHISQTPCMTRSDPDPEGSNCLPCKCPPAKGIRKATHLEVTNYLEPFPLSLMLNPWLLHPNHPRRPVPL